MLVEMEWGRLMGREEGVGEADVEGLGQWEKKMVCGTPVIVDWRDRWRVWEMLEEREWMAP